MSLELNCGPLELPEPAPAGALAAARHVLKRQWLYWYLGCAVVLMILAGGTSTGSATALANAEPPILMGFAVILVLGTLLGISASGWSGKTDAGADGKAYPRRALQGCAGIVLTGLGLVLLIDLGTLALSPYLRQASPAIFLQYVTMSISILLLQVGMGFCFGSVLPGILALPISLVLLVGAYFEPGRRLAAALPDALHVDRLAIAVLDLVAPQSGMLYGGSLGTALRYHLPYAEVLRCFYYQAAYGAVYLMCGLCLHRLLRSSFPKREL
ncbi:MAG: hypothetical protein RBU21_10325 [FCB group bacterium]|jgi:hypothetical protein|nr:hypothetical protein [FCB group bacterium]